MNKKNILYSLMVLAVAGLSACDDYLDVMPDNRTEVDNEDKVTKLLVSAYSRALPIVIHEQMSDNVTDAGTSFAWRYSNFEDSYLFHEKYSGESEYSQDSPAMIWASNYSAVAAANMALQSIDEMEAADASLDLSAQRGEALICRAYAHFVLVNTFCQAYNPQSSSTDLGIPYVLEVEDEAIKHYERGTVAEVYEKMAQDIEAGLPLIDDNLYTEPKYHFNRAAANSFAAQFYLYYGNYQRAVECATAAIGTNPTNMMRTYEGWNTLTGSDDFCNAWVDSQLSCNFFLQGLSSVAGRMYNNYYSRSVHTRELVAEVTQSRGPWGNNYLRFGQHMRYYNYAVPGYMFPKQTEFFVYTDAVQGIGQPYIMNVVYSTEKTLLNRAEAYVMLGQYENAARDLSYFYIGSQGTNSQLSADAIAAFYENASDMYKKPLAPRFTISAGMQENLIHACLHARRILTVHEGTRTEDLKRFGIAYTHVVDRDVNIELEPYDARLALQIPNLVIEAGMEPNPR